MANKITFKAKRRRKSYQCHSFVCCLARPSTSCLEERKERSSISWVPKDLTIRMALILSKTLPCALSRTAFFLVSYFPQALVERCEMRIYRGNRTAKRRAIAREYLARR